MKAYTNAVSSFYSMSRLLGLPLMGLYAERGLAQTATPPQQPSMVEMLLPIVFIFGIFYFLIFRPQQKKQKEHQAFVTGLKRGDSVVTSSGIVGIVKDLNDQFVSLEVADGVVMKIVRGQVTTSLRDSEGKNGKS